MSENSVINENEVKTDAVSDDEVLDKLAYTRKRYLTPKEIDLLLYLTAHPNVALSRTKLLEEVWNYDYFGDARTIDTHVKKLRSKLGEKGNYIKTIWGMGYKFEVEA